MNDVTKKLNDLCNKLKAIREDEYDTPKQSATEAIRKAFMLGQLYCEQANSELYSQNKKADETMGKYKELLDKFTSST